MNSAELKLIPVVLCGGSGTRLWPLSRRLMPKQFMALPQGSLFSMALARLAGLQAEDMIVACNAEYRFSVAEGIRRSGLDRRRCSILLEPEARDTAPAIALAAQHALSKSGGGLLLILPSDHIIKNREEFQRLVGVAAPAARDGALVTFGIVPRSPETGYGYIRKGEALLEGVFQAAEFREKPDADEANVWFESGRYYWNSGMFLFDAQVYLDALGRFAPEVYAACRAAYERSQHEPDFIRIDKEAFSRSPKISIDYAVMEKTDRAVVVPAAIDWSDVGSWESLGRFFEHDERKNAFVGDVVFQDAENNVAYSSKRLVSVLGVDNCLVVETPDTILVADKTRSQEIKNLVADLEQQRREEVEAGSKVFRPWGSYERVDADEGFQVKRIIVNPGQSLSLQSHRHRSEHWVVVRGRARVTLDDKVFFLEAGQSTYISAGTRHRLENPDDEPLFIVEVQCGSYLGEDDIKRFADDYGRTEGA